MTSGFRLLVRAAYWVMGDHAEHYGKCTVYGPDQFLATFRAAFHIVSVCDVILGERITSEPWMFIFTGKSSMLNAQRRVYGINEAWAMWREHGLAVHLVHAGMIAGVEDDFGQEWGNTRSIPLRRTTELDSTPRFS